MASSKVRIVKDLRPPEAAGKHYRLLCMTGKNKGLSYFLKGQRIVMGRAKNADIQVLDTKSSREHGELKLVGEDYVLTDLGSQNGIIVNDLKITQHKLKDRDKIIIGQTVFKFSLVVVKDHLALVSSNKDIGEVRETDFDDDEDFQEPNPEAKKKKILLLLVALLSLLFLFPEEEQQTKKKETTNLNSNVDVTGEFTEAIRKKIRLEEIANKKECSIMIKRGLRELREKNYFRAMEEFEDAKSECVGGNADFYLNKARQNLDEAIQQNKIKAARETEALKYQAAIVSYCSVVRLLQREPTDKRYLDAISQVRLLEKKLGYLEGEVKCFQR